jgi:MFS family permease
MTADSGGNNGSESMEVDAEGTGLIQGSVAMEIETCVRDLGFGPFHFYMLTVCGLVFMADAMEVVVQAFVMPLIAADWDLSPAESAIFVSIVFFGMLIGSYILGILSDKFGRRFGYLVSCILCSVFGIISAFSPDLYFLTFCRFWVGFGVSGVPIAYSLFCEFLPDKQRGAMLMVIQMFWTAGTVIEAILAWVLVDTLGLSWRWLFVATALPVCLALFLFPLLPESPRYQLMKGNAYGAFKTFRRAAWMNCRRENFPIGGRVVLSAALLPQEVALTFDKMGETLGHDDNGDGDGDDDPSGKLVFSPSDDHASSSSASSRESKSEAGSGDSGRGETTLVITASNNDSDSDSPQQYRFYHIFNRKFALTTSLLWILWFTCVLVYYGVIWILLPFLQWAGIPKALVYPSIIAISASEIGGLFLSAVIINPLGRKKSMGLLLVVTAVTSGGMAIRLHWFLSVALAFIARGAIMGAFCIIYAYTPEVYPTAIRSFGVGSSSAVARLAGMVSPFSFAILAAWWFGMPLLLYAATGMLGGLLCMLLPIETAGRSLTSADT